MNQNGTLGSIIVPAHNEAASIGRCLTEVMTGLDLEAVEIIVACNGCTDDTVAIARSVHKNIKVLDLERPGKTSAIRAAERIATALPRIYLDADTRMSGKAAVAILKALDGSAVAARPPVRFDLDGCSGMVRRYWEIHGKLPTVTADLCGAGVYGLSAAARARFDEFPDLSGDDLFAARIVSRDEVVIVPTDSVIVRPPRTLKSHIKVLKRVHRGNAEFLARFPELARPTTGNTMRELLDLAKSPGNWIDVAAYAAIAIAARVALVAGRSKGHWERDESARIQS